MQAIAKVVVRPEHVLGIRLKVLALKKAKRSPKDISSEVAVRPFAQIFGKRHSPKIPVSRGAVSKAAGTVG